MVSMMGTRVCARIDLRSVRMEEYTPWDVYGSRDVYECQSLSDRRIHIVTWMRAHNTNMLYNITVEVAYDADGGEEYDDDVVVCPYDFHGYCGLSKAFGVSDIPAPYNATYTPDPRRAYWDVMMRWASDPLV